MREKVVGANHFTVASTLENYAKLLRATERETEASEMEARAKAIRVMTKEGFDSFRRGAGPVTLGRTA